MNKLKLRGKYWYLNFRIPSKSAFPIPTMMIDKGNAEAYKKLWNI